MSDVSNHKDYYTENEQYAEFLDQWDPGFYAKYIRHLRPSRKGGRALDIGCGTGRVVEELNRRGAEAHGVDVSEPNIRRAEKRSASCILYDGTRLPFPDDHFETVGSMNVLEHVDAPEEFIREMVRVTKPGGRIVLSSPNFLRVLGFRDYHPRMRGLGRKLINALALWERWKTMKNAPGTLKFERMPAIVREPFQPDDDAIVATNPLEMKFFLERSGCAVMSVECTDRDVHPVVDFVLNATPARYLMFNAFLVSEKLDTEPTQSPLG